MAEQHHLIGREELMKRLKDLDIDAVTVEHPEVFTVEAMLPYVGHLSGAITKNLLLRDKKRRLYLFSARHDLPVDLNDLSKRLGAGSGGLRFADESLLREKLGVRQGCVTAFALINDVKNVVTFVVDSRLLDGVAYERVYFHPMENTATTGVSPADFLRFLDAIGHKPTELDFGS